MLQELKEKRSYSFTNEGVLYIRNYKESANIIENTKPKFGDILAGFSTGFTGITGTSCWVLPKCVNVVISPDGPSGHVNVSVTYSTGSRSIVESEGTRVHRYSFWATGDSVIPELGSLLSGYSAGDKESPRLNSVTRIYNRENSRSFVIADFREGSKQVVEDISSSTITENRWFSGTTAVPKLGDLYTGYSSGQTFAPRIMQSAKIHNNINGNILATVTYATGTKERINGEEGLVTRHSYWIDSASNLPVIGTIMSGYTTTNRFAPHIVSVVAKENAVNSRLFISVDYRTGTYTFVEGVDGTTRRYDWWVNATSDIPGFKTYEVGGTAVLGPLVVAKGYLSHPQGKYKASITLDTGRTY